MQVDGETQTGWFRQDFTLTEIKTLGAISTDAERQRVATQCPLDMKLKRG